MEQFVISLLLLTSMLLVKAQDAPPIMAMTNGPTTGPTTSAAAEETGSGEVATEPPSPVQGSATTVPPLLTTRAPKSSHIPVTSASSHIPVTSTSSHIPVTSTVSHIPVSTRQGEGDDGDDGGDDTAIIVIAIVAVIALIAIVILIAALFRQYNRTHGYYDARVGQERSSPEYYV